MRQPGWRGVWERRDTCICTAEPLHCSLETSTTLLIGYPPTQKVLNKNTQIKKTTNREGRLFPSLFSRASEEEEEQLGSGVDASEAGTETQQERMRGSWEKPGSGRTWAHPECPQTQARSRQGLTETSWFPGCRQGARAGEAPSHPSAPRKGEEATENFSGSCSHVLDLESLCLIAFLGLDL